MHPSAQQVRLRALTLSDAPEFAALYADPAVNHGQPVMSAGESAMELLRRIGAMCEIHLGIFVNEKLAGDCALHHWDAARKDIEIGGALLPGVRGSGIMALAFMSLIRSARELGAARILGRTDPGNGPAIRLVKKLGFRNAGVENGELLLILEL